MLADKPVASDLVLRYISSMPPAIKHQILTLDPAIPSADRLKIRDNFSAIVSAGKHLWLGGDEGTAVDRMTVDASGNFGQHQRTDLGKFFKLAADDQGVIKEIDIEGLDLNGGYLWVVGSHCLKRKKAEPDKPADKNRARLVEIDAERNRHTLARVPVDATGNLAKAVGGLTAARLDGDAKGDQLTNAIRADKHLGPSCSIPSKENGLDIEGFAVTGKRVFIGLRGPVLRGWAVIVEFQWKDSGDGLISIDGVIKKHFLQLGGLGIRDLAISGKDLYILAGPTMELDGPVFLYRWPKALDNTVEAMIWQSNNILEMVLAVPFGEGESASRDHAEGIALIAKPGGGLEVMICYDSPASTRLIPEHPEQVLVDVFQLG